jgi:MSHA pilin protein MshC
MTQERGFTTIELVTVIIIMAILAVNVLPRFNGTASYEAHTHRAQLISALRLTQQRAMQQTDSSSGFCHQIVFDDLLSRYGVPNRINCTLTAPTFPVDWEADATGHVVEDRYQVFFNINGLANPQVIAFDWMGRPLGVCNNGCTINVNGSETLSISIEAEGYIHAD